MSECYNITYNFQYGETSESNSTADTIYRKITWLPMGMGDRLRIVRDYNDGRTEHIHLVKWLVMEVGTMEWGNEWEWEIHVIPCAEDGSSPFDTPFFQIADMYMWDELIREIKEDRAYSGDE